MTDFTGSRAGSDGSDNGAAANSAQPEGRTRQAIRNERGRRSARVVQFDGTPMYTSPRQERMQTAGASMPFRHTCIRWARCCSASADWRSRRFGRLDGGGLRPPRIPRERSAADPSFRWREAGDALLPRRVNPAERPSSCQRALGDAAEPRCSGCPAEQTQILVLPPEGYVAWQSRRPMIAIFT